MLQDTANVAKETRAAKTTWKVETIAVATKTRSAIAASTMHLFILFVCFHYRTVVYNVSVISDKHIPI